MCIDMPKPKQAILFISFCETDVSGKTWPRIKRPKSNTDLNNIKISPIGRYSIKINKLTSFSGILKCNQLI